MTDKTLHRMAIASRVMGSIVGASLTTDPEEGPPNVPSAPDVARYAVDFADALLFEIEQRESTHPSLGPGTYHYIPDPDSPSGIRFDAFVPYKEAP